MTIKVNTNKELDKQELDTLDFELKKEDYKKINVNFLNNEVKNELFNINFSNFEKYIKLKNKYKQLEYLTNINTQKNEEYHFLNHSFGKNYLSNNDNKTQQSKKTLFSKNQISSNHFESLTPSFIKDQEKSFEDISQYIQHYYLNVIWDNTDLFEEQLFNKKELKTLHFLILLHLLSINNYFEERLSLVEIFNSKNKTKVFKQCLIHFVFLNQKWLKEALDYYHLKTKESLATFFYFLGVYHEVKSFIFTEEDIQSFNITS